MCKPSKIDIFDKKSETDCTCRADISASTALSANLRIDGVVLLTFMNSAQRAFVNTGTASNAVVGNFVSHDYIVLMIYCFNVLISVQKYNKNLRLPNFRDRFYYFFDFLTDARAARS